MDKPRIICLDFDGTIMRYDDPPEHFHPVIVAALNQLGVSDTDWIANSGRSFEGQHEIVRHCMAERGLNHPPCAIISNEAYIYVRDGVEYVPLEQWNRQAAQWAREVNRELQHAHREALEKLVTRHAPQHVYLREDGTVFQMSGPEEPRFAFIRDLEELLRKVRHAELIHNGEWVAVIHEQLGKGNVLRAYLAWRELAPDTVLAVGDHGNDISMLNGSVTPFVACPGDAFPPVRDAVRRAGGYVAQATGAHGTLEAFQFFFGHDTTWPDIKDEECQQSTL